jgi:hypothetical protein
MKQIPTLFDPTTGLTNIELIERLMLYLFKSIDINRPELIEIQRRIPQKGSDIFRKPDRFSGMILVGGTTFKATSPKHNMESDHIHFLWITNFIYISNTVRTNRQVFDLIYDFRRYKTHIKREIHMS